MLRKLIGILVLIAAVTGLIYAGNTVSDVTVSDVLLQATFFVPLIIGVWLLITGRLLFVYSPPDGATKHKFSRVESLLLLFILMGMPIVLEVVIHPARWPFGYEFALAAIAAIFGLFLWILLTLKGKRV